MIKNIIFDWSGVISDDLEPVYKAAMIVMKKVIGKEITIEEFRREFELPVKLFWSKYLPEDYDEEKNHGMFLEAVHSVDGPKIYNGVKEILGILKQREVPLFLISSHPYSKLIIEIREYGVEDNFVEIIGGARNKVDAIKEAISKHELYAGETVYVGDMTYDIEAGKEAGVKTVAVTYGYQDRDKLAKTNPDYIISDFRELLKITEQNQYVKRNN